MSLQQDYFVLCRAGPNTYPLLGWDQSASAYRKGRPVPTLEPVKLRLGEPVPPRPVMVDYHGLPEPVVSTRVKDAMEPLGLEGAQLVPADVRVGETVLPYWLLHVHARFQCMDRERSVFRTSSSGLLMLSLSKLVLDEAVLADMPLARRSIFVLAESTSVTLVHRTVVERVLALTPPPEGLRFIPVGEWSDAAGFKGNSSKS
jgi:hypothetical protein